MKIKYFGTAASEGLPGLFCNCRVCRNAIEKGGKEIRTRSQALIDDKILIDFPADTYMHVLYGGLDLKNIHTCIVTHNHSDHLYEKDIWCRISTVAHNIDRTPLAFYFTKPGYEQMKEYAENNGVLSDNAAVLNKIIPFVSFEAEGYKITPLKANHDINCEPVFYIIEKDGKFVLYAHDTGTFPDDTKEYLLKSGIKFDLVSLDCTMGKLDYRGGGHAGIAECKDNIGWFKENNLADEDTIFCLNHFSHNGDFTHDELVDEAEKFNAVVAYDGMEIEF